MSYSLPMVQSSLKNAENLERNWTAPKSLAVLRNDDTRRIVSCKNRYFKLPAVTTSQGWGDTWGPLRCQAQQGTNTEVRKKWRLKVKLYRRRLLCLLHLTFVYHGMPSFCGIIQISISENKTKQKPWLTFTKTIQWRWIWKKINIEMKILLNKWYYP